MSVKMMAWTESEKHCGLGPIYQENEDPKSVDFLFNMVHKSLMAEFEINVDDNPWIERPIVSIQSHLSDIEVINGIECYMEIKEWPEDSYTGQYINCELYSFLKNLYRNDNNGTR